MKDNDKALEAQIEHLREPTQDWIRDLVRDYTFEPGQLKLLILAGDSWDRTAVAREELKSDGITIKDRFDQIKKHPAATIERDSRSSFARLMKQLKLDIDPPRI